jgi:hypothetical protein
MAGLRKCSKPGVDAYQVITEVMLVGADYDSKDVEI